MTTQHTLKGFVVLNGSNIIFVAFEQNIVMCVPVLMVTCSQHRHTQYLHIVATRVTNNCDNNIVMTIYIY